LLLPHLFQRVSQRPAHAFQADLHDIAIQQTEPAAKAKGVGAKEMDMCLQGDTVARVFEMMMFEIPEAMGHVFPV